jgi:hypothetical protein
MEDYAKLLLEDMIATVLTSSLELIVMVGVPELTYINYDLFIPC